MNILFDTNVGFKYAKIPVYSPEELIKMTQAIKIIEKWINKRFKKWGQKMGVSGFSSEWGKRMVDQAITEIPSVRL